MTYITYRASLEDLTIYATDTRTGEVDDLNAAGEPCTTVAELREFIVALAEEGAFSETIRDRLLADLT